MNKRESVKIIMSNQGNDLITILKECLSKDKRFVTENGELIKASITSASMQLDSELISLLLNNEMIKNVFFTEIDNVLVFDKVKFNWIVSNKEFLPDSYTKYKNKIGVSNNDYDLMTENNDISLVFPYKDSVLEGGQTDEEEQKDEVFYNEVLSFQQVRNLLAPKALTNAKKYTKNNIEEVTNIDETDNLVIKGNNLLALSSLLENYRNKIKLIYIDPPYNTGNDSFQYNDKFNHSTWLTFMKNRLEIARELLSDEGVIVVQLDYHENSYLRVLMDEIFGRENYVSEITVQMSTASGPKMAHIDKRVPKLKDSLLIFKKNNLTINKQPYKMKEKWDSEYSKILLNFSKEDKTNLEVFLDNKNYDSAKEIIEKTKLSTLSKEYPEFKNNEEWLKENAWRIVADKQNTGLDNLLSKSDKFWSGDVSLATTKKGNLTFFRTDKDFGKDTRVEIIFAEDNLNEHTGDIWTDISTSGGFSYEGGINFPTAKKPEKLLKRIIEMFTKENEIVLDFFGGSFTTVATAMKLNRKFITIEQMDYIETISIKRLINVINGDQTGISKEVNWQGGGNFVYFELKELNEKFRKKLNEATKTKKLKTIYKELKDKGLLIPSLETHELENEEFENLSFEQQKEVILLAIDKNKLYVNASQVDDEEINLSDYEKELTLNFYGKESSDDTRQGTLSI